MLSERPKVILDEDIIFIDFWHLLISKQTILDSIKQHKKLAPNVLSNVIIQGEAAIDLNGEVRRISSSEKVTSITKAIALVPISKIGFITAKIYMGIMTNPYPTKVFSSYEDAKVWLKSL